MEAKMEFVTPFFQEIESSYGFIESDAGLPPPGGYHMDGRRSRQGGAPVYRRVSREMC
jgi:hypothetical protein